MADQDKAIEAAAQAFRMSCEEGWTYADDRKLLEEVLEEYRRDVRKAIAAWCEAQEQTIHAGCINADGSEYEACVMHWLRAKAAELRGT